MFRKNLVILSLVVMLALGQILPTSAQDAADTVNDVPADTAISTEVPIMLDTEGMPLALPGLEAPAQETAEAVPDSVQAPGIEYRVFLPTVFTESSAETGYEVSAAWGWWNTIKSESFEGVFPSPGWTRGQCFVGYTVFAEELWGRTQWTKYSGSWSVGAVRDGRDGKGPGQYYGNKACSWMAYGPFSLANAKQAKMTFKYQFWSAMGDRFWWLAKCTGTNWSGPPPASSSTLGWQSVTLDLGNIPGLGSCVGKSEVWIAFQFASDMAYTNYGPFVDDVLIEGYYVYP